MKRCGYCGRDNDDSATRCGGCGSELPAASGQTPARPHWPKMVTVRNEAEAERLDLELTRLNIPHMMISYRDSAFDGIYQTGKGWGHVEAPEEHAGAVLSVLEDLRKESGSEPQESETAEPGA